MHKRRKSVFLVLRVNCQVLEVQSPVWFKRVLPEFAQTARRGKSSCTEAWQSGPSSVILLQTDKACAHQKLILFLLDRGYWVCLAVLTLLLDFLTSQVRIGEKRLDTVSLWHQT